MRILIVNNYAHVTGGADLHCLGITEGLRQRGHEVRWLATSSSRNQEVSGSFIPLAVAAGNRDEIPWWRRIGVARRAMWNPDAARAASGLVDAFRPDVVHVHKAYVQLSVAPVVVARRRGVPTVQTVHDYEFLSASPLDAEGGGWDHDETRLSYRALNSATLVAKRFVHKPRITRWIAVSDSVSRSYRSAGGIECTVIPNFTESSDDASTSLDGREGVLYLGRLSPEKGVDHVLEAAKRMPDVEFTMAGDGPMRDVTSEAAAVLPNLRYVGFVTQDEARELIRGTMACLMPSLWQEPGPLACLEAMAEGTPVVCYPNGGLAEYVQNSRAGIVCRRPEASDLTEALRRLVSNSSEWCEFSVNGRQGVRSRHTLSGYIDSLEAVYRSAINGRRQPSDGKRARVST